MSKLLIHLEKCVVWVIIKFNALTDYRTKFYASQFKPPWELLKFI